MKLKQLFIFLLINLFCVYSLNHAMAEFVERLERLNISTKNAQNPKQPTGPNYFEMLLPKEIKDEIAEYLPSFNDKETDLQFIERTKNIPQGNEKVTINYGGWEVGFENVIWYRRTLYAYNKRLNITRDFGQYAGNHNLEHYRLSFSCSPDVKKVVYGDYCKYSIVDLKSGKEEESFFDHRHRERTFAISSDKKIAIAEFPRGIGFTIVKILESEFKTEIPIDEFKSIAFNKQGTKIIVHGQDSYQIIPIVDEATHREKSKKTLADYFRQKGVRKSLK